MSRPSPRLAGLSLIPALIVLLLSFAACGTVEIELGRTTSTPAPDPTPTSAPADTPTPVPEDTPTPPPSDDPPGLGNYEGFTYRVGVGSEATFTVEEKLASLPLPNDAVVRTTALSGEVHFDGRPSVIEIDLHAMESDQPRRDRYIRERMFPNDRIAIFTLPTTLPLPDGFSDGEEIVTEITGTLEIRGVQAPVTFQVEARDDGDVVHILGRTTFVWSDFEIPVPNVGAFVRVTDEVTVEILLSARPADLWEDHS